MSPEFLNQLKQTRADKVGERDRAAAEVAKLDGAIATLSGQGAPKSPAEPSVADLA